MSKQCCYFFDEVSPLIGKCGEACSLRNEAVGEKGAALYQLIKLGIKNIPEGFVVTGKSFDDALWNEIQEKIHILEEKTSLAINSEEKPLFLSVRSSKNGGHVPAFLNIGLNEKTVAFLANASGNSKLIWALYKKYIEQFATVILGEDISEKVAEASKQLQEEKGYGSDAEFTAEDLEQLCEKYKEVIPEFPQDASEQLKHVVQYFIKENAAPIIISKMVHGFIGEQCGSGFCSLRSPQTGEVKTSGKFIAAGEGTELKEKGESISKFEEGMSELFAKLSETIAAVEKEFKDIAEVQFVVENGELYILGMRIPKKEPLANIKVAFDLCTDGKISKADAIRMVSTEDLTALFKEHFEAADVEAAAKFVKGKPAAKGEATGSFFFNFNKAKEAIAGGQDVILWKQSFTQADFQTIALAKGVFATEDCDLSAFERIGIPAVVACEGLVFDKEENSLKSGETEIHEGDPLSIVGSKGLVLMDKLSFTSANVDDQQDLLELLKWADEITAKPSAREISKDESMRGLMVMATCESGEEAEKARAYGALGVGLCSLNSMLLGERAESVKKLLTATDQEEKEGAISELEEGIAGDLGGIFEAMSGLPIKIRLLNTGLQEFFPGVTELAEEVATMKEKGKLEGDLDEEEFKEKKGLYEKVQSLTEVNPRIGNRGARLLITNQDLLRIQIRAIVNAACTAKENEQDPQAEVIIPFVCSENELAKIKPVVDKIVAETLKEREQTKVSIKFGCSIELPRAAMIADRLAQFSDSLVIDVNSLTQLSLGLTKEEAEKTYLSYYRLHGIVNESPFKTLDKSVQTLLRKITEKGRKEKKSIFIGISGEQSADPAAVRLCHSIGMNYVSCEPSYKILVARLVAAKAVLEDKE